MRKKLRVAVLSGGRGAERLISLKSGEVVSHAIDRRSFDVLRVELTETLEFVFPPRARRWAFLDGMKRLKFFNPHCVFLALHGDIGEDGHLQALLELCEIPFVGSGFAASVCAMDKGIANTLLSAAGLRIPRSCVIRSASECPDVRVLLKRWKRLVLKPLAGGSSVGVLISQNRRVIEQRIKHNLRLGQSLLLQEYLQGREVTCGVIEQSDTDVTPLVPTEIRPVSSAFFDYHAKYGVGASQELTPPALPRAKIRAIQNAALRAHTTLGCRGFSRSDFILAKGRLFILEVNTLPGMTETSLVPQGAAALGISLTDLLTILIRRALRSK